MAGEEPGKLEIGKRVYVDLQAEGLKMLLRAQEIILIAVNDPFVTVRIKVEGEFRNIDLPRKDFCRSEEVGHMGSPCIYCGLISPNAPHLPAQD